MYSVKGVVKNALVAGCLFLGFLVQASVDSTRNLIKEIRVEKNKVTIVAHDDFAKVYLTENFFAEYEKDVVLTKLPESIITMPFLLMVLTAVWISGEDYYVEVMDYDLYNSMTKIKKVVKVLYPKTSWKGRLIPRKLIATPLPEYKPDDYMALLFSGGLDSTVSSLFHDDKKQLLISAWGQWDLPLNKPELWKGMKERFLTFAHRQKQEITFIRSNYASFINRDFLSCLSPEISVWRIQAIEDVGWAGLTAPILYSKGYSLLRIASSDTWDTGYPILANPFIDNNIRYAGIHVEHDLFDYSRLDKIEFLAKRYEDIFTMPHSLSLCSSRTGVNCCNCSKCLSTAIGLMVCDADPNEYGLPESRKGIIENAKRFLSGSITFVNVDRFKRIADKVRQRLEKGDAAIADLAWLLAIDFDAHLRNTWEYNHQETISWKVLHKLFSHIRVPQKLLT